MPFHFIRTLFLVTGAATLSSTLVYAQCPVAGNDTICGTVITITDAGSSISYTGEGGYNYGEGSPETLVGIVNNSSLPVYAIGLSSTTQQIFAFYGDGIDNYGVAGNSQDNTGYGGPNAYFTNIDPTQSIGVVNFVNPIPAGGGTDFFSLPATLNQATACSDLIGGRIAVPAGGGTTITSSFTPNFGYTLAQAAAACGFTAFNWQQLVTYVPQPSPFYEANTFANLSAPAPFNDPPPMGYTFQAASGYNAVGISIYYNLSGTPADLSLAGAETANTLSFFDAPADPFLAGGDPTMSAPGTYLSFSTHLVGILGTYPNATVQDTGIGFTWIDTFNGTSGGVAVLNSARPVDPGSGTGGIAVTSIDSYSSYQYPKSVSVKTINGKPAATVPLTFLTPAQVTTTASGLAYSRVTRTFDGTVTIKNVGNQAINGPLQILILSLSKGVTLTNGSGSFGGSPYIAVPKISSLPPAGSVTVKVQFSNPSSAVIKFSPATYLGGFN